MSLVLCACQRNDNGGNLRTVAVCVPESYGLSEDGAVSLPGTVREAQMVNVSFKTGGQISRLYFKEGDYVNAGQLVATLDASDYQIALNASSAQYRQVKNEAERVRQLYERKSVSKNEYEKAEAGLEQVSADLQAKKNQLQYTRLYSPVSGFVKRIDAHVGEMVNAGTTVLSLIDVGCMEVEVEIPYSIYRQRDSMRDFSALLDGKVYPLVMMNIIPQAGRSQQYTMLLALPPDREIKTSSGMNVEVRFSISGGADTYSGMTIPESAVIYDGSRAAVWVITKDSTVSRKDIVPGTVVDGRITVREGLDGSETIVRAGASMLHQGEKVRILPSASSTNPGKLL